MSDAKPSELFPFSYYDLIRKRWVKARYLAELPEIEARYKQWRLEGPPEIRSGRGSGFMVGNREWDELP